MLELAASYREPQPVRIKAIADAQGISARFLVQILLQLKTAGLVASIRGAAGGYQLAHAPETITLAAIINALDDQKVEPRQPALSRVNPSPVTDVLLSVWHELHAVEQKLLEQLTLAELLRRAQANHALSYQI